MKARPVIVNGPRDHVHILFSLPPFFCRTRWRS
jgi:hypothetical protein